MAMRKGAQLRTRSLLKRIARGGVLAAGITMLLGCEVAATDSTHAALSAPGDRDDDLDPAPEATAGNSQGVVMCSLGTSGFNDIVVDESAVAAHLAAGDVLGDCSQFFCGGS